MRRWILFAIILVALVAYGFYYFLGLTEEVGTTSFELVNAFGLVVVVFGVLAAVILLRRTSRA